MGFLKYWFVVMSAVWIGMLIALGTSNDADAADPYEVLPKAVVRLSHGSGGAVKAPSGKTYILTNAHVCVWDTFPDKVETLLGTMQGDIVKIDPYNDLCLIKPSGHIQGLTPAEKDVQVGDAVYNRGYPRLTLHESQGTVKSLDRQELDFTDEYGSNCPRGFTTAKEGSVRYKCAYVFQYWHSDLYCDHGSSGSPIVNKDGELVGVMQTMDSEGEYRSGGFLTLKAVKEFLKGF